VKDENYVCVWLRPLPQLADLISSLKERLEEQERWARAREKTAKQLGSNWGQPAGGDGFGRC